VVNNYYCQASFYSMNSMICQQYSMPYTPSNAVAVSSYVPSGMVWGYWNDANNTNGVYLATQTGATYPGCSSTPREALIIFLCRNTTTLPNTMNVSENVGSGCMYQFVIYTNIVCGPPTINPNIGPLPSSSSSSSTGVAVVPTTTTSSSSSSLSNGAIAGIVIGVVLGVLIVFCLGCILYFVMAGGKRKKADPAEQHPANPSTFNSLHNEPSTTGAHDVEMETHRQGEGV